MVVKHCEKSPRITPRAPKKANTPFQMGNGRAISLMASWVLGNFAISKIFRHYFANGEILQVCDAEI